MYAVKKFVTERGNWFIYDVHKNSLLRIDKKNFSFFENEQRKSFVEIETYKQNGYFKQFPLPLKNFSYDLHPESLIFSPKLVICLTEDCNFRCRYCIYSGLYESGGYRTHSKKEISMETIKRGVDYYLSRFEKAVDKYPLIVFYGGEPLLAFSLLQKTVAFALAKDPSCLFGITTNGSLLTEPVCAFFAEHNFQLSISVDGPQKIHDGARVFRNGRGSFATVLKNITFLQKKYPSYYDSFVNFSVTYDDSYPLEEVLSFFAAHEEIFPQEKVQINSLAATDKLVDKKNRGDLFYRVLMNNTINNMLQGADKEQNYVSRMGRFWLFERLRPLLKVLGKNVDNEICYPGGCCYPGNDTLILDTDGNFSFCEKINTVANSIGCVQTGLDRQKIGKIIKEYEDDILENCKKCWGIHFCRQCFFTLTYKDRYHGAMCKKYLAGLSQDFALYLEILERDAYFFRRYYREFFPAQP